MRTLLRDLVYCFAFIFLALAICALIMLIYHAPETARELNEKAYKPLTEKNDFLENVNFLAVTFSAVCVAITLIMTYRQLTVSIGYNRAKLIYDFLKDANQLHEKYVDFKEKLKRDKEREEEKEQKPVPFKGHLLTPVYGPDDYHAPYVLQFYYNIFQTSASVGFDRDFMSIVDKDIQKRLQSSPTGDAMKRCWKKTRDGYPDSFKKFIDEHLKLCGETLCH